MAEEAMSTGHVNPNRYKVRSLMHALTGGCYHFWYVSVALLPCLIPHRASVKEPMRILLEVLCLSRECNFVTGSRCFKAALGFAIHGLHGGMMNVSWSIAILPMRFATLIDNFLVPRARDISEILISPHFQLTQVDLLRHHIELSAHHQRLIFRFSRGVPGVRIDS